MNELNIQLKLCPELFFKDPNSSELGKKIVSKSIELINILGFENFTFKKLGKVIGSPESTIYRYFENKHVLLVYVTNWYWSWTDYRLLLATTNISSANRRLEIAIDILTKPVLVDNSFSHINEVLLSEIIFSESLKVYNTKKVDEENQKGYFKAYKDVVARVSDVVIEINPKFKYPHMLISTVIEGAHQQKYFSEHLPALTDTNKNEDSISDFYKKLTFNLLNNE
ncbi:MAG: TetR/AcrR family transcriptional regulator [Flavobacteriaceae bacterium]|nr:TetR/AcrR family transcriptional regulator [Flavobacteriaceae bacterium]